MPFDMPVMKKKKRKRGLGVYDPPSTYSAKANPIGGETAESAGDRANMTPLTPMASMESKKRDRPKNKKTIFDL